MGDNGRDDAANVRGGWHPAFAPTDAMRRRWHGVRRAAAARIALPALLLALLAALTAPLAAAARTLVFCSEGNPSGMQPALLVDGTSFDASSRTIYDRLLDFRPGSDELAPALATAWQVSADGLNYTLQLRRGVRFQRNFGFVPTREFDADDVVFTFARMADARHPYHAVSGGAYPYYAGMELPRLLRAVRRVDAHTVRFELSQPNAAFLADLTMDFASIVSAEYAARLLAEHRAQDFDLKPVGTGPFELVAWEPGAQLRYRAFAEHWRGPPAIDRLVFAITPDASVRWARLRAGECQLMAMPNPADLKSIEAAPGIVAQRKPGMNIAYLAFNTEHGPLRDRRVRRALALAIDRDALVRAVYQGAGVVARGPLPPTLWAYDPTLQLPRFDPAAARRLLVEAGYPKGFSLTLWAFPNSRPYLPSARRAAEMIQADWERVGVHASIRSYEWAEYLRRVGRGEHDAALYGWSGDNGDPDNFLGTLLNCGGVHTPQNIAEYCNRNYQELIDAALTRSDRATRRALYAQAQRLFVDDLPWLPLAHAQIVVPMSNHVRGYTIPVVDVHEFGRVTLD